MPETSTSVEPSSVRHASRLSLAAKLYSIFALFAVLTAAITALSDYNTRRNAELTEAVETASRAALNVERVNSLVYAVVMESRGVYMSTDTAVVKKYGDGLLKFNDQILDRGQELGIHRPGRRCRAIRHLQEAHRAVRRIPQGTGSPRHRDQPRRRPRMGRQRRQPRGALGAQQGSRSAVEGLCRTQQADRRSRPTSTASWPFC